MVSKYGEDISREKGWKPIMKAKSDKLEYVLLVLIAILPTIIITLNLDSDFWFLYNHGNYVVNNGFPNIEPFTIHNGLSFVMQQWLSSLIFYLIYSWLGKAGVILLIYIVGLVTVFLLYSLAMIISHQKKYLSVIVSALVYIVLCMWFVVSRPQVFTYIVMLLELIMLEKYTANCRWSVVLGLSTLSLLLINLHASMWWMLFAFIIPYLVEGIRINKISQLCDRYKVLPLLVACVTMFAAGFVNPYGYKLVGYIFSSYGNEQINSSIEEMSAPDIKSLSGAVFFFICFAVVLVYILNKTGKTKVRYICLALGTTLLALMSIKSMPYFLFATVIPLVAYLENQADKLCFKFPEKKGKLLKLTVLCFLLCICFVSGYIKVADYSPKADYPAAKSAIEKLGQDENKEQYRVYTSFVNGAYAETNGLKTYIDARAEVFLKSNNGKEDIFAEYISLEMGDLHYKTFLDKYNFSHVIVTNGETLDIYLSEDDDYSVLYEDTYSRIYIKDSQESKL